MPLFQPRPNCVVAVAVCNTAGDSPSVILVDMAVLAFLARKGDREAGCWLAAIHHEITTPPAEVVPNAYEVPTAWEVLLTADPGRPAKVTDVCTVYYDG